MNEIRDDSKFITNHEFNKLTAEANLVNKTDFDKKLRSFNKRLTSNKIKHLEVQKKLNSPVTKDNNFFLGRIRFTSNGVSQNTFVSQPTLYILELKKITKLVIMFLVGNQREYVTLTIKQFHFFT